MNKRRPINVFIKKYKLKRLGWTGSVTITLISRRERSELMNILVNIEKERLLVTWADMSEWPPVEGLERFLIVKKDKPKKPVEV
jgi:hypothetical protein